MATYCTALDCAGCATSRDVTRASASASSRVELRSERVIGYGPDYQDAGNADRQGVSIERANVAIGEVRRASHHGEPYATRAISRDHATRNSTQTVDSESLQHVTRRSSSETTPRQMVSRGFYPYAYRDASRARSLAQIRLASRVTRYGAHHQPGMIPVIAPQPPRNEICSVSST